MARPDELRGYALKNKLGLVPHRYPAIMRGVQPPITPGEAYRIQQEYSRRAAPRARRG